MPAHGELSAPGERRIAATLVEADITTITARRTGGLQLEVDFTAPAPRSVGGVGLEVEIFTAAAQDRIGWVGVEADIVPSTAGRQVGSVGAQADLFFAQRQAGAIAAQVDLENLVVAARRLGTVAAQVDLLNQVTASRRLGTVAAQVDLLNNVVAIRRLGAVAVQLDLKVLAAYVPTSVFFWQRRSRSVPVKVAIRTGRRVPATAWFLQPGRVYRNTVLSETSLALLYPLQDRAPSTLNVFINAPGSPTVSALGSNSYYNTAAISAPATQSTGVFALLDIPTISGTWEIYGSGGTLAENTWTGSFTAGVPFTPVSYYPVPANCQTILVLRRSDGTNAGATFFDGRRFSLQFNATGALAAEVRNNQNGAYQGRFVGGNAGPAAYVLAALFAGSSGYVAGGTPPQLPLTTSYSLEGWFNLSAAPSGNGYSLFGYGNFGTNNQVNALRVTTNTRIDNYWWNNDLNQTVLALGTNTWHYVVATWDGTTRRIYLDGVLQGTATASGLAATTANYRLGSAQNAEFWTGWLSYLAIYNQALTGGQITQHYNAMLTGATRERSVPATASLFGRARPVPVTAVFRFASRVVPSGARFTGKGFTSALGIRESALGSQEVVGLGAGQRNRAVPVTARLASVSVFRTTQAAVEVLTSGSANLRTTQAAIETLTSASPNLRTTQGAVEVLTRVIITGARPVPATGRFIARYSRTVPATTRFRYPMGWVPAHGVVMENTSQLGIRPTRLGAGLILGYGTGAVGHVYRFVPARASLVYLTNALVTEAAVEVAVQGGMAGRVSAAPIEAVVAGGASARVDQAAVEAVAVLSPFLRVTATPLEVAVTSTPHARLTQVPLEVVYAISNNYVRTVPASTRFFSANSKAVPAKTWFSALGLFRQVPATRRLRLRGTRTIPALTRFGFQRVVPVTARVRRTFNRTVPATAVFPTFTVISDTTVKARSLWNGSSNNAPPTGWTNLSYDDSLWTNAVQHSSQVFGVNCIWVTTSPASSTEQAIFRQKFFIPPNWIVLHAYLQAWANDDVLGWYLNDTLVVGESNGVAGPVLSSSVSPTLFRTGDYNQIAAQGRNTIGTNTEDAVIVWRLDIIYSAPLHQEVVPVTARFRGTRSRNVPATRVLKGTAQRQVPATASLTIRRQRAVPASSRFDKERRVPVNTRFIIARQRSVPATRRLRWTRQRIVPIHCQLGGPPAQIRTVPATARFSKHLNRNVPVTVHFPLQRRIPIRWALRWERHVPAKAPLFLIKYVPVRAVFARPFPVFISNVKAALGAVQRTVPATAAFSVTRRTVPVSASFYYRQATIKAKASLRFEGIVIPAAASLASKSLILKPVQASLGETEPNETTSGYGYGGTPGQPGGVGGTVWWCGWRWNYYTIYNPDGTISSQGGQWIAPDGTVGGSPNFQQGWQYYCYWVPPDWWGTNYWPGVPPRISCNTVTSPGDVANYDFFWTAWGSNTFNQLGYKESNQVVPYPINVEARRRYHRMYAGQDFCIGMSQGRLFHWGTNNWGQRSNNNVYDGFLVPRTVFTYDPNNVPTPGISTPYIALPPMQQAGAGSGHCIALDINGQVWTWGRSDKNQTGFGSSNAMDLAFLDCYHLGTGTPPAPVVVPSTPIGNWTWSATPGAPKPGQVTTDTGDWNNAQHVLISDQDAGGGDQQTALLAVLASQGIMLDGGGTVITPPPATGTQGVWALTTPPIHHAGSSSSSGSGTTGGTTPPVYSLNPRAGVNIDPSNPAGTPNMDQLEALGVGWVRVVSRPSSENYAAQCQSKGLKVLASIARQSTLSGEYWSPTQTPYLLTHADIYEVGNEPDLVSDSSWTMTPDQYVQLWNQVLPMTNKPKIVGGQASGQLTWWQSVAPRISGAAGFGVHPYGKTPADAAGLVNDLKAISPGLACYATEWFTSANEIQPMVASLNEVCAQYHFYCWSDGMNQGFGLVTASQQAKAEYNAYQLAIGGGGSTVPPPPPPPPPNTPGYTEFPVQKRQMVLAPAPGMSMPTAVSLVQAGDLPPAYFGDPIFTQPWARKTSLPPSRFVTAGANFSMVVGQDNSLWVAGDFPGSSIDAGWTQINHGLNERILRARGGNKHAAVITESGALYMFGVNNLGQLGNGGTGDSASLILIDQNVLDASPFGDSTMVLHRDGSVAVCGDNSMGQCGQNFVGGWLTTLQQVLFGSLYAEAISYGCLAQTAMVVLQHSSDANIGNAQSEVWAWGNNASYQLLDGSLNPSGQPRRAGSARGVTQIALGFDTVYASDDDTLGREMTVEHWRAWGEWDKGATGAGRAFTAYGDTIATYPMMLAHSEKYAGFYIVRGRIDGAMSMDRLGRVHNWGQDQHGQLGSGAESFIYSPRYNVGAWTPLPVPNIETGWMGWAWGNQNFVRIFEGDLMCWGQNDRYQLGTGTNQGDTWLGNDRLTIPFSCPSLHSADVAKMVGNDDVSFALLYDGRVLVAGTDRLGLAGTPGAVYPTFTVLPQQYSNTADLAVTPTFLYLAKTSGDAFVVGGGLPMQQLHSDADGLYTLGAIIAIGTAAEHVYMLDWHNMLWGNPVEVVAAPDGTVPPPFYLAQVLANSQLLGPSGIGPSYLNPTALWVAGNPKTGLGDLMGLGPHLHGELLNGLAPSQPNPILTPTRGGYSWPGSPYTFDMGGGWRSLAESNAAGYAQLGLPPPIVQIIRRARQGRMWG